MAALPEEAPLAATASETGGFLARPDSRRLVDRRRLALPATALAVAVAALAFAVLAPAAGAHAAFVEGDPAPGANLATAPVEVRVILSEPVDPSLAHLDVTGPGGQDVTLGPLRIDSGEHPVLRRSLQADLPPGVYRVSWEVLSTKDGHGVPGSYAFAVGEAVVDADVEQHLAQPSPRGLLGRAVSFLGFSLAFGAFAFHAWLGPSTRSAARMMPPALVWGSLMVTTGALLLIHQTRLDSGASLAALLATRPGHSLLARVLLGLAASFVGLLWTGRKSAAWGSPGAVVFLLGAAAWTTSSLGHPAQHGLAAIAIDWLHLLAAGTWVGALAFLWAAARSADRDALDAHALRMLGRRFSTLALVCLGSLVAAGSLTAIFIMGREGVAHPSWLWTSRYGLALTGKILLVAVMAALGGVNRAVLLEPAGNDGFMGRIQRFSTQLTGGRVASLQRHARPAKVLSAFVAFEAVLGVAVVLLAAVLTSVSPPASPTHSAAQMHAQGDSFSVHMTLDPPPRSPGSSVLTMRIQHVGGGPLLNNTCGTQECVRVSLASTGSGPQTFIAVPVGGGTWRLSGDVLWARPGPQVLRVDVEAAGVPADAVAFTVRVAAA